LEGFGIFDFIRTSTTRLGRLLGQTPYFFQGKGREQLGVVEQFF